MASEVRVINKLIFCTYFAIIGGLFAGTISENVANPKEENKVIKKRYDIDFQTCVENFDIHKDKIIRTQDSRAMGAKYINELDVSSREECLRLCCETSTCDVFVFEEKNPGSCYLFHCGTPDDFKCKFTKHHNYTSAVLALNSHMTELETQIKLTKHEEELTRLRKPETAVDQSTPMPFVATSLLPPGPPPKERVPLISASTNSSTGRRCSRYQFECHSSGECIAIYNACDGIPQCADGSDEALELDCPDLGTTQPHAPPIPTLSAASGNKELEGPALPTYQQPQSQQQQHTGVNQQQLLNSAALNQPVPDYNSGYRQQQQQHGWAQPQQTQQYGGTQSGSNGINLNNNQKMYPVSSNMQQQSQQQLQNNKLYGREGEGANFGASSNNNLQWQGYQQQQQSPQIPPAAAYQGPMHQYQGSGNREYEDQGSHIFNHKGNGLVADSDSSAAQYGELSHNDYKYGSNGPGNYYNSGPYRQPSNNWQLPHQPPVQDMNSLGALDDIPPHMSDGERNIKMGSEGMRGGYNSQPIPPDYYYEDSQEGRFHPQHTHEAEHHTANHVGHAISQGEQENIADGATPIKNKEQNHPNHKSQAALEAKQEADIATIPKRKGSGDKHDDETRTNSSTEVTTSKSQATKAVHGHTSKLRKSHKVEIDIDEVNLSETIEEEPGRPSGAILSLALGLCITGIMVVLIGCRLRVVRRRLRRGGKSPYAHDADYLVNGMYL